jgi:bacillithiol system protein YtxJ
MGFLDKIFKGDGEEKEISKTPWNNLETELELTKLKKESTEKVVVIFKHSTRCGISRMAKRQFESEFDYDDADVKLYYLDLITYRNISNKIAEMFGVFHESPQLIILKDGNVVHHASHSAISAESIQEYI